MKRAACGVMMVVAVILLAPLPSQAGGHGWRGHGRHGPGWYGHGRPSARIHVGLGFPLWWGPGPGWWGPRPAWHARPVYAPPPRVVVMEQPVYVQREPVAAMPPSYWYYCGSAGGYYPDVPSCPEPWVQVPPRME